MKRQFRSSTQQTYLRILLISFRYPSKHEYWAIRSLLISKYSSLKDRYVSRGWLFVSRYIYYAQLSYIFSVLLLWDAWLRSPQGSRPSNYWCLSGDIVETLDVREAVLANMQFGQCDTDFVMMWINQDFDLWFSFLRLHGLYRWKIVSKNTGKIWQVIQCMNKWREPMAEGCGSNGPSDNNDSLSIRCKKLRTRLAG